MTDKRLTDRISSRIRCEFIERKRIDTHTLNVSRNGIFVIDTSERNINSLVRMRLFLPPNQEAIEIFGRIAWKGTANNQTGHGIHFLKLESADRKHWLEFVTQVEMLDSSTAIRDTPQPTYDTPDPGNEKRAHPRASASFMVRFRTTERLEHFIANNLSEGGMFLKTPVLRPIGEKVQVVLVHPDSERDFEIEAEVAHLNEFNTEKGPKGMGLRFVGLSPETQEALEGFLRSKK